MTYLAILLCVLGVVFAVPIWLENRRQPVDARYRERAPGEFAQLSQGVTHYKWGGSARGPVLVAIHGLTTPSIVWDNLADDFGLLGYRVLSFDLYGRGLSDAPKGLQDEAFFARQLDDLLEHLDIEETVSLIGYSMGGSIAGTYAAANPHRVDKTFLVASAGFATTESDFSRFCRERALIGDWIYEAFAGRRMRAALIADQAVSEVEGLKDAQLQELNRQGFVRAVLSSRRGMLDQSLETPMKKLAERDLPVFAVWGDSDPVIPIRSVELLRQWHPKAKQRVIANADHALPYSHGDFVIDAFETMLSDET